MVAFLFRCHCIFSKYQNNNNLAFVQAMDWHRTGDKHYSTENGPVYWSIYASLGFYELTAINSNGITVYPKKYAHGFVVLCFVVVMQSFIMNSHEVFIHIHQGCFAGTGAIVRLPQCQWSKPDGYGKISQCITTTKHSKANTVCIFLGIYCIYAMNRKSLSVYLWSNIIYSSEYMHHGCQSILHRILRMLCRYRELTENKYEL